MQIKSGTKFIAISAGVHSSFAIDDKNNLWVWGKNNYGQLAKMNTTNYFIPQLAERNDLLFTSVSGTFHGLAMDINGVLWSWGRNHDGQLGLGDTTQRTVPLRVNNLP